jgi:hypothetical protein
MLLHRAAVRFLRVAAGGGMGMADGDTDAGADIAGDQKTSCR